MSQSLPEQREIKAAEVARVGGCGSSLGQLLREQLESPSDRLMEQRGTLAVTAGPAGDGGCWSNLSRLLRASRQRKAKAAVSARKDYWTTSAGAARNGLGSCQCSQSLLLRKWCVTVAAGAA